MKHKAKYKWTVGHDVALERVKKALTGEAMAYLFIKNWKTELKTDASPTGLSAVLSQIDPQDPTRRRIVLYSSQSLRVVECKYSQVEREALAVVFAFTC
jgi:hypothetical protein